MFAAGGLRSTFFTVRPVRRDKKTLYFVFQGGGWGHAVGLCQSGAAGLAEEKKTYPEILYHYYQNTRIERLPW